MRHRIPAAALVVALTVMLVACAGDDPEPAPAAGTGEPTESTEPSETEPNEPAAVDWRPVPGPVADEVTVSGEWTLAVTPATGAVQLTGPEQVEVEVPQGFRVTDALIDGHHAVVVAEHEQATRPNVATVVDLATGATSTVDGDSDVPTTVGGTWALGSGLLVHATSQGRDYCLAVVDLAAGNATRGPCVPPRHGITNARITPAGITAMSFDDSRPSCRTLGRVEGTELVPLQGVEECAGWEAVTTETAAVWAVVENERRIEESRLYADAGSGPTELGPGTTGTLTWCGDAAWFVRDPQRDSDRAQLVRVAPDGTTETVYESPGKGNAFLSEPRCGGTDLTVTAYSGAGDEQVTTPVG